jgi:hypothetical protein
VAIRTAQSDRKWWEYLALASLVLGLDEGRGRSARCSTDEEVANEWRALMVDRPHLPTFPLAGTREAASA